jgi:hypothetical protein
MDACDPTREGRTQAERKPAWLLAIRLLLAEGPVGRARVRSELGADPRSPAHPQGFLPVFCYVC